MMESLEECWESGGNLPPKEQCRVWLSPHQHPRSTAADKSTLRNFTQLVILKIIFSFIQRKKKRIMFLQGSTVNSRISV